MGCCNKKLTTNIKHIVQGYVRLFNAKVPKFAVERIKICKTCDCRRKLSKWLWCSICKCYIPAKARVEEEKCPLSKWPEIKVQEDIKE